MTRPNVSNRKSRPDRPEGRSIGEALAAAIDRLEQAGVPEAEANAYQLLSHITGLDRGGLFLRRAERLDPAADERLRGLVERRALRVPLQHLIGTAEFYGLEIEIDGRALVPRPETEGLVDAALGLALPADARVADFGTGSGCIAVALAVQRPGWSIVAVERSAAALQLAADNVHCHEVEDRVRLVPGDFAQPALVPDESFDLVVSNPPYVPEEDWRDLEPEVFDHDPRAALVPGPTGYESHTAVADAARRCLVPGGWLLLEIGYGQAEEVERLLSLAGLHFVDLLPDFRGIPRVARARRPGPAVRGER